MVDNNTLSKDDEKELNNHIVDVIKLNKNFGFAKANNKAISYAREKYNPDYYCVINNDVFITDKGFAKKIESTYLKYKFDMLGPYINSPSGESVNPFMVLKTRKEVEQEIHKCKKLIKIYNSIVLYFLLKQYLKLKRLAKKTCANKNGKRLQKNVALHGCCIIFSKQYIEKYKYPFYNDTFLYHEEEFLYQRIIKDGLTSIYNPKMVVYHQEGASSKKNSMRLSLLAREKERLKSLLLLINKI